MSAGSWIGSLAGSISYIGRHPVGRRDPLGTVLRIARWQASMRFTPGLQQAKWVNDSRLLVRRGMTGVTGNLYYGLHEFAEMSFIALLLREGDLFADVGANAGSYTVLASKVAGAHTLAFEPGETAQVFAEIVALNAIADKVELRREAVGDHVGETRFTCGLGTMNKVDLDGEVAVPMTTLDVALGGRVPIAIKFDIEGGEDAGMRGAAATLAAPGLQALLIETVSEETAVAIARAGLAEVHFDPWLRELHAGPPRMPANNRIYIRDRAFVAERLKTAPRLAVAGLDL